MKRFPIVLALSFLLSACGENPSPPVVEDRPVGLPPVVRTNIDRARLTELEKKFAALEAAKPLLPKIGIDQVRLEKVDYETRLIASFKNEVGATVTAIQCRFFERDVSGKARTDDRVTFFFREGLEPGATVERQASEVHPAKEPGLKPALEPILIIGKNRQVIADGSMTEGEIVEMEALRKKAGQ